MLATVIAIIYFLLGLFIFTIPKNTYLKIMISFLLLLPTSSFAYKIFSINGIASWDFYFLGILIVSIFYLRKSFLIKRKLLLILLIVFSFLYIEAIFNIYAINSSLLKDLRYFFCIIPLLVLINPIKTHFSNSVINKSFLLKIVIINLILDFSIYLYLLKFGVPEFLSSNQFYIYEKYFKIRYSDIGGLLLFFFFIYFSTRKGKYIILLMTIFTSLLLSGSRTVMFILFIFLIYYLLNNKKLLSLVYISLTLVFILSLANVDIVKRTLANVDIVKRISETPYSIKLLSLLIARFSPALEALNEFSNTNWFLGKGLGYNFTIPWFKPVMTDPISPAIDNLYLTYLIKFGILSIIPFILYFVYLKYLVETKKDITIFYFVFLLISLTSSPFYQSSLIIFLIFPIFYYGLNNSKQEYNKSIRLKIK